MSIVLVNIVPERIKERRYDKPNFPSPSLGILFSYLKAHNIECDAIDSKLERLNLAKLIKRLKVKKPKAIGFTAFTHEIENVAYSASLIRKILPEAKFIIGGVHSIALPKQVLSEFPVFDIAVIGEGEETLMNLLNSDFERLNQIRGIAYRKDKNIFVNEDNPALDLSKLPIIDWSRFPKGRYYPVFTSRGCSHDCIFCARPFGQQVRSRPIDSVLEEIKYIWNSFHPKYIYFWDENFCVNRTRTFKLLEEIRRIKGIKWFCQSHINSLGYELLKAMKVSGCIRIGIGIESGNEEILNKIKKGITKERIVEVVSWIKKVKIPIEGYFLLGHPNENWKTCMETIKFATKLNPEFPTFGIVVPYPGTEIYNMAIQGRGEYKIITKRWRDYNKIIGWAMELETLSRRELTLLQLFAYLNTLIKNLRFFDIVKFALQFHRDVMSCIRNYFRNIKFPLKSHSGAYKNFYRFTNLKKLFIR